MNDKKSCENCILGKDCPRNGWIKQKGCCETWQRNPSLWLDMLPTEPGWYWWKAWSSEKTGLIYWIENYDNGPMMATDPDGDVSVKEIGGYWQGPLTPKG